MLSQNIEKFNNSNYNGVDEKIKGGLK